MVTTAPLVLASWQPPQWAETCTMSEEAVVHSRVLGHTENLNGSALLIELVQRDELTATNNSISMTRHPAYLRLVGELVPAEDAAHLAALLTAARDLMAPTTARPQPCTA